MGIPKPMASVSIISAVDGPADRVSRLFHGRSPAAPDRDPGRHREYPDCPRFSRPGRGTLPPKNRGPGFDCHAPETPRNKEEARDPWSAMGSEATQRPATGLRLR